MLWISRLFRLLAMVLALIFVVSFPLTLAGRDFGQLVFDPQAVTGVISENLSDNPGLSFSVLDQFTRFLNSSQDSATAPAAQLVRLGLRHLTQNDIQTLLDLTVPPDLIADAFVQIVTSFYDWLENDQAFPTMQLNVAPLKENLLANRRAVLETILHALPDCSAEQLLGFAFSGDLGNLENLPVCQPPEPLSTQILDLADVLIPVYLDSLPETLDISQQLQAQFPPEQFNQIKTNLLRTRSFLRWAWLPVGLLYLVSIPMWSRSWPSLSAWTWPLGVSGLIGIVIALSLWLSAAGVPQLLASLFFENSLGGLFDVFRNTLADLVIRIARPLAWQSAFQIILGLLGWLVAFILIGLRRRARFEVPISSSPLE